MKRILVALLSAAALVAPVHADDVVTTAENARSLQKFVSAIKAADLDTVLRQPGPYTVFAPSDEAVSKLPKGMWEALLKDKPRLEKFIAAHIVAGKFLVAEVKPGDMRTLEGESIHLTSDNGMVTINGAHVTQSDLVADNGVIHEIDQVVLPD